VPAASRARHRAAQQAGVLRSYAQIKASPAPRVLTYGSVNDTWPLGGLGFGVHRGLHSAVSFLRLVGPYGSRRWIRRKRLTEVSRKRRAGAAGGLKSGEISLEIVILGSANRIESVIVKLSHYGPFLQQLSRISGKMTRNVAPKGLFLSVFSFATVTIRSHAAPNDERRMIGELKPVWLNQKVER
jgi:hypothetical protein